MLPPHGYRLILLEFLFYKQLHIFISIYFCFSLILNSFYNIALSNKKVSLFNLLFQIRPGNLIWSKPALSVTLATHPFIFQAELRG